MNGFAICRENNQFGSDIFVLQSLDDLIGFFSERRYRNKNVLLEFRMNVFRKKMAKLRPQRIILENIAVRAIRAIIPNCISRFRGVNNRCVFHLFRHCSRKRGFSHAVRTADPYNLNLSSVFEVLFLNIKAYTSVAALRYAYRVPFGARLSYSSGAVDARIEFCRFLITCCAKPKTGILTLKRTKPNDIRLLLNVARLLSFCLRLPILYFSRITVYRHTAKSHRVLFRV